jgi:hypothetical protein
MTQRGLRDYWRYPHINILLYEYCRLSSYILQDRYFSPTDTKDDGGIGGGAGGDEGGAGGVQVVCRW